MSDDCIKAQITAKIKAKLAEISIAGGYSFTPGAIEESRQMVQVNNRWPLLLILENDPINQENLFVRELEYIIWTLINYDDTLTGTAADANTESAYMVRNVNADIAKCLAQDETLEGLAEHLEVRPGNPEIYEDESLTLFGTWCRVIVTTDIDQLNPYGMR